MRMFRNDYSEGAAPEVLAALIATNDEQHVGYTEGDPYCERARELIREACGRDDPHVSTDDRVRSHCSGVTLETV